MCSATFYIIWYTLNKIAHFKSVPLLFTVSSIFGDKIVHIVLSKLFRYFLHYLVYFETKSCTMVFQVYSFLHSQKLFQGKIIHTMAYKYFTALLYTFICFLECEF